MSDQTNAPTGEGRVNMSGGLTSGPKIQNMTEVLAIVSVAIVIIGGAEFLLWYFEVKEFVMPRPSAIVTALFVHFDEIAPHFGYTLVELAVGYTIGASIGMILAAVITQFPFVEKIITPYILLL
ncbi:MAG: ABC transporter permease, partial [Pseudomonadota bacterium]